MMLKNACIQPQPSSLLLGGLTAAAVAGGGAHGCTRRSLTVLGSGWSVGKEPSTSRRRVAAEEYDKQPTTRPSRNSNCPMGAGHPRWFLFLVPEDFVSG